MPMPCCDLRVAHVGNAALTAKLNALLLKRCLQVLHVQDPELVTLRGFRNRVSISSRVRTDSFVHVIIGPSGAWQLQMVANCRCGRTPLPRVSCRARPCTLFTTWPPLISSTVWADSSNCGAIKRRLIVENDVEQRAVYLDRAVVFDEAELAEAVHEETYARAGGADHLR